MQNHYIHNGKMRIGELASRTGVSTRVIRYYESLGLLGEVSRTESRYRQYTEEAVVRLSKIDVLKNLGLSLEEIRDLMELYFENSSRVLARKKLLGILRGQLADTDEKLASLNRFRSDLLAMIEKVQQVLACPDTSPNPTTSPDIAHASRA